MKLTAAALSVALFSAAPDAFAQTTVPRPTVGRPLEAPVRVPAVEKQSDPGPVNEALEAARKRLLAAIQHDYPGCRDVRADFAPHPDVMVAATCDGKPLKLFFDAPARPTLQEGVFRYTSDFGVRITEQGPNGQPSGRTVEMGPNYKEAVDFWRKLEFRTGTLTIEELRRLAYGSPH